VVALPPLLDAPPIAAGELVGATGLVCEFIRNIQELQQIVGKQ